MRGVRAVDRTMEGRVVARERAKKKRKGRALVRLEKEGESYIQGYKTYIITIHSCFIVKSKIFSCTFFIHIWLWSFRFFPSPWFFL